MQQKEALHLCRTFVSHFRAPGSLANQANVLDDPKSETFVIGCADSRLGHHSGLTFPLGTEKGAYTFDGPGPSISPQPDVMLTGFIKRRPNTKNILIVGHTHCAAKRVLFNALLKDSASLDGFEKKLLEATPEGLREAVQAASETGGMSKEQLQDSIDRVSLLQSTLNLYQHATQNPDIKDRVASGELRVSCAIRDIETNALLVYVPSEHQFRNIEDIHQAAGRPSIEVLESAPSAPKLGIVGGADAGKLVVKSGTSTSVAELAITDLQAGIRSELSRIELAGKAARSAG